MVKKIPDISEVDFKKGDEVCGFGQLLISSFHEKGRIVLDGQFSYHQAKLVSIAKEWLRRVEIHIDQVGVKHRASIIDQYNMLYRLVLRVAPDLNFVNRVKYSVVEAILKGNKDIDLAQAMWMISFTLRTSRTFDFNGTAQRLHDSILKKWYDDFAKTGNFLDMSQKEALQRGMTLIREDISHLTGNPRKVKEAVAARISLLFNNLLDKDADTLMTMMMYLRFAEGRYVDNGESDRLSLEILDLLSVMPQLNKFDRMAFACDYKILTEQILIKNS